MATEEKKKPEEKTVLIQFEKPKGGGFKVSANQTLATFFILSLLWLLPVVNWAPDYGRPLPVRETPQATSQVRGGSAQQTPTDCDSFSVTYSHTCVMSDTRGKAIGADQAFGNETFQFCWKHSDKYTLLVDSIGENVFGFRSQKGAFVLTYWLAKGETAAVCDNRTPPEAP